MYISSKVYPLALSTLVLLSGTPTAIDMNMPPIKPPICAKLSIPEKVNPMAKFNIINGII